MRGGPALENDYISDNRVPSSGGGGAQASVMAHDNQQDVRIEYLYSSQALQT